jgi:hypothetical protein
MLFSKERARDEESPVRAERAWFLYRGERSPNRERDSFVRIHKSLGVPRGYVPLVAGLKPEKGRQGALATVGRGNAKLSPSEVPMCESSG